MNHKPPWTVWGWFSSPIDAILGRRSILGFTPLVVCFHCFHVGTEKLKTLGQWVYWLWWPPTHEKLFNMKEDHSYPEKCFCWRLVSKINIIHRTEKSLGRLNCLDCCPQLHKLCVCVFPFVCTLLCLMWFVFLRLISIYRAANIVSIFDSSHG